MKRLKKLFSVSTAIICSLMGASCGLFGVESNTQSDVEIQASDQWYLLENVSEVKNVVLLIGDGMGPEHIKAGEIYKGEELVMQKFPYKTKVDTNSLDGVTDSAAASTAMATGKRTYTGYIGLNSNEFVGNEGEELTTIVDIVADMGKRVGILTTEALYGATPMGFSAHATSRNSYDELLASAATTSNVNLFASCEFNSSYYKAITGNGYSRIMNVEDISDSVQEKIFGAYNIKSDAKSMTAGDKVAFDYLVTEALEYLSQDEDGFFLMAEGAMIDKTAHDNNMENMLSELLAFDDAVKATLEWAKERSDTVVIVTADHETGCLTVGPAATKENILDKKGVTPLNYLWASEGHTGTEVWCFVNGKDIDFAQYSRGIKTGIKNTDIFEIIKDLYQVD